MPEGDGRIPFCREGNEIAYVVAAIMQILEARRLLHSFFLIVSLILVRVWIPELNEKSLKLGMFAACCACVCWGVGVRANTNLCNAYAVAA